MWREAIDRLFEPIAVGANVPSARFAMPAMNRGWYEDGVPSDRYGGYYAERGCNGVGLAVTGANSIVSRSGAR